jgi:hypothetical protein
MFNSKLMKWLYPFRNNVEFWLFNVTTKFQRWFNVVVPAGSSSLLQGKHLPFSPSPLRLNIFRLFLTLSLTQLYRYTPEIFLFSTLKFGCYVEQPKFNVVSTLQFLRWICNVESTLILRSGNNVANSNVVSTLNIQPKFSVQTTKEVKYYLKLLG